VLESLRDASKIRDRAVQSADLHRSNTARSWVRDLLEQRRDVVVGVSPIIDGHALKGPADRLLAELGHECPASGARLLQGLIGTWIIDEPTPLGPTRYAVRGVDVVVTTTIMPNPRTPDD